MKIFFDKRGKKQSLITTSLSVFVFELHLETTQNVEELDARNLDFNFTYSERKT